MTLEVKDLTVIYRTTSRSVRALDRVNLVLSPGRITGLIGESGSGKTTLGKALMGLLPENSFASGSISLEGTELIGLNEASLNAVRWSKIAMVFQHGAENLNPVHRVVDQIAEPLRLNRALRADTARKRAEEALSRAGLDPELGRRFPHELSGGQIQRALLAMAMICDPKILILDEPTAALDALTKMSVANLIRRIGNEQKCVLLITHDLDFAQALADDLIVLYSGQVMEVMPSKALFAHPLHPYTVGLARSYPSIESVKDLGGIRGDALYALDGDPPRYGAPPAAVSDRSMDRNTTKGCVFQPRCTQAVPDCRAAAVELIPVGDHSVRCLRRGIVSIMELRGISKRYDEVRALECTDLDIKAGEVFCLVGETGSGKTTLALIAAGVLEPDAGSRSFEGCSMDHPARTDNRPPAGRIAMIYQSPAEAVSHRFSVFEIVAEPLRIQRRNLSTAEVERQVISALTEVRLPTGEGFLNLYPHELNMGAVQRVCMARALIQKPSLLIADEPTSSLDPSVQAKVVKMLLSLQVERGMTMLFVTHDIGLARKIADRIGVMFAGRLVEVGPAIEVVRQPGHPYTRLLLNTLGQEADLFVVSPKQRRFIHGCSFAPRCARARDRCVSGTAPPHSWQNERHMVSCWFPLETSVHIQGDDEPVPDRVYQGTVTGP